MFEIRNLKKDKLKKYCFLKIYFSILCNKIDTI